MSRKKILWLCSWYPDKLEPFNGDFIQRHAQAAALFNDIYVLHLAGDSSGSTARVDHSRTENNGVAEHLIYFPKKGGLVGKIKGYYRWSSLYMKAIDEYIREYGKPDLVHVHVPMRDGLIALRIWRKHHVPFVVTEHWTIYQPGAPNHLTSKNPYFKSILKRIVRESRHLLPVSDDLGQKMNKLVIKKPFTVVENVADIRLFCYEEKHVPQSGFRFIHVSNMSYQKNVAAIINSFLEFHHTVPMAELVIVGAAPADIIGLAENAGLINKSIFFKGELTYLEVANELKQAECLVMFSRYENSPCSIIEALCCGLPVIATQVGGIPELVNEENGLLITPGDESALVKALMSMIYNYSRYDRRKISDNAASKFSYEAVGKKLDSLYQFYIKQEQ